MILHGMTWIVQFNRTYNYSIKRIHKLNYDLIIIINSAQINKSVNFLTFEHISLETNQNKIKQCKLISF